MSKYRLIASILVTNRLKSTINKKKKSLAQYHATKFQNTLQILTDSPSTPTY